MHSALPVCEWPALGIPYDNARYIQPLKCAAGVVEPELGAAAGLGSWFVGVMILTVYGDFQRRRQHLATTAHRALPVCERPAVGMPRGTALSKLAAAVCSRCGGACAGAWDRAGQVIFCGCSFTGLWRFPEEEAALGNHSAQRPASVWVTSSEHTMGHRNVKCSLCCVQQL